MMGFVSSAPGSRRNPSFFPSKVNKFVPDFKFGLRKAETTESGMLGISESWMEGWG